MKITNVTDNSRKKVFEITIGEKTYLFPYAKMRLEPSASNPVVEVFPDPELGGEAFTYRLKSGDEDTIHLDAVLEVNKDPDYLQALLLHRLTVEALEGIEKSGLGKRQLARQLGTSASQLYRLLDPENTNKSVGQMLALLSLVNLDVDLLIYSKSSMRPKCAGVFQVYKDKSGYFRFRLKNSEGSVILSSDAYRSKQTCLEAIKKVRNYAIHESYFERKTTNNGRFQFRLKAKNHHVIARSPAYESASRRDAALATVRQKAPDVQVEEVCV
ncbi:MAG: DUF1508 domain-containing protein [Anaerolineales bacterium]|jgi:uncharacterized protein